MVTLSLPPSTTGLKNNETGVLSSFETFWRFGGSWQSLTGESIVFVGLLLAGLEAGVMNCTEIGKILPNF